MTLYFIEISRSHVHIQQSSIWRNKRVFQSSWIREPYYETKFAWTPSLLLYFFFDKEKILYVAAYRPNNFGMYIFDRESAQTISLASKKNLRSRYQLQLE